MTMSHFEQLANDIEVGVSTARDRIRNFGYGADEAYAVSCINASILIWLVATTERHYGGGFRQTVLDQLPENDPDEWEPNISPIPAGSLRDRLRAIWAVRIAYTHGTGRVSDISDTRIREWADTVPRFLPTCRVEEDLIDCSGLSLHVPIRSFVQLRDVLPVTASED